ncbi:MAG TPA: hypothetical protein VMX54_12690 [Vicinamibacteria bacterium]|nr:hypothetical protein [Vicinamibacteria bacterium]
MKTTFLALALAATVATPVAADRADDDLAAVKKAVHSEQKPQAAAQRRPAEAPPVADEDDAPARLAPRHTDGPRWFHVRIAGKGAKQGRVSISLPLGLVRAVGQDWPIQGCHRCEHGHGPTIGDVLRSLDSGQSLVEIDDPEATVRVWVE